MDVLPPARIPANTVAACVERAAVIAQRAGGEAGAGNEPPQVP